VIRFSNLRRSPFLREPLVHFLLFGAITLASQARQPVVTIDAQDIEQLAKYWELQSQRAPTRAELAALINEWVDEELLVREAIRLGLDKEDMIARRRLAQEMAFTSEDVAALDRLLPMLDRFDLWFEIAAP
jgi:peptidyl-prolyl cis-trans isomerase C